MTPCLQVIDSALDTISVLQLKSLIHPDTGMVGVGYVSINGIRILWASDHHAGFTTAARLVRMALNKHVDPGELIHLRPTPEGAVKAAMASGRNVYFNDDPVALFNFLLDQYALRQ